MLAPKAQAYEFEGQHEGMDYYFTVLFQYGADEQTIYLVGLDVFTV
jgi:hypothetical protein